jgi:hypothetical protein
MLESAQIYARYAAGLRGFLREPMTDAQCLERLRRGLASRETSFLDVMARGVYGRPASPYRKLLEWAGVELDDVARLVELRGVEGALDQLYDAGVYISLEEFRGDRPIERPGLLLPVTASDFDNPFTPTVHRVSTGGSRSDGRRIVRSFAHMAYGTLYHGLVSAAHGLGDRPRAIWHPIFPSRTGLGNALHSARQRRPLERWFSQSDTRGGAAPLRATVLTHTTLLACRLWAVQVPSPEYVPLGQAERVARWLETKSRDGTPALFSAPVGSGVRVCLAAAEHGLDIGGTVFRLGGEPLTPARAEVVAATGSRALANYSMGELGRVGIACAAPTAVDDVHLMQDRLALVQRDREVPVTGERVGALFFTSLHPSTPKLMLNVETDDHAIVEDRTCGCLIGELGFSRHLRRIRSWEKLTSEGMRFGGPEVVRLLEETLPGRFGGAPTDYQFVEETDGALPAVAIVISTRLGPVDEKQVVQTVVAALGEEGIGPEQMSSIWRDGRTLRVVRREPYATPGAKILSVHVRR